tara:strand:- start:3956 stop:4261 length:306 start_codon:yes stop_codon:yes gene_type:complete
MKTISSTLINVPYTVSKNTSLYLAKAGIKEVGLEVGAIWNPWMIMVELNAGTTIALSIDHKERMVTYFRQHGISLSDFTFGNVAKDVVTISRNVAGISCNC